MFQYRHISRVSLTLQCAALHGNSYRLNFNSKEVEIGKTFKVDVCTVF